MAHYMVQIYEDGRRSSIDASYIGWPGHNLHMWETGVKRVDANAQYVSISGYEITYVRIWTFWSVSNLLPAAVFPPKLQKAATEVRFSIQHLGKSKWLMPSSCVRMWLLGDVDDPVRKGRLTVKPATNKLKRAFFFSQQSYTTAEEWLFSELTWWQCKWHRKGWTAYKDYIRRKCY